MKVFICWSGSISRRIARSIHDWLPNIIQNVEPFMSTEDIEEGARWLSIVQTELQDCHFGLICLTRENLESQWIHFEAGSLSKIIDRSRVVPVLFNLEHSDVRGPLTHFQMVKFGEEEMFRIVEGINNSGVERKIDPERLKKMALR
jgi:TIR domain